MSGAHAAPRRAPVPVQAVVRFTVRNRWSIVAAALLATYVLVLWADAGPIGNIHTGDTDNVVAGSRAAIGCLRDGTFVGCGTGPGIEGSLVFPYALLQYLPAMFLLQAGQTDAEVIRLLARLNTLAFVAALALGAWSLRRDRRLAGLASLAVLGSSATFQATAGFSEMLSATWVLAAVVVARARRVWLIGPVFFVATLGKETLPPFLLLLGLIAARKDDDGWLPPRRLLVPIVGGITVGALSSMAFNVFRFATIGNVGYLDPALRTPGIVRKAIFVAALWGSPSAGIAWFWPIATLVMTGTLLVGLVDLRRSWRSVRRWGPPLGIVLTLSGFVVGLSFWCTPFGWIAYGPRLAVPILPALVVLALHVAGDDILAAVGRARSRVLRAVVVILAVGACWAQLGAPWRSGAAVEELVAGDHVCPGMKEYPIQADPAFYYRCAVHVMWRLHPSVLDETLTGGGPGADTARGAGAGFAVIAAAAAFSRRQRSNDGERPA